tara:strand:- start:312 stop:704 length:393 start_codon:yes stop_codon:yes gene_type:complete
MDKVITLLRFIFHISVFFLIVISLYPGSLIGYFLYGDMARQPNLLNTPLGTSINHFIYYFYISLLGFCVYIKSKNFEKLVYVLFFLSITLEILQLIVPNRAFQLLDLITNFLGVLVAFFLIKIYLLFSKP